MKQFHIQIDEEDTCNRIKAEAKKRCQSTSGFVKYALLAYLKQLDNPNGKETISS